MEVALALWNRFQLLILFLRLVKDPNRTDLIFRGVDRMIKNKDLGPLKEVERTVMAHAEFRRMYDEKYCPPVPNLEALKACPEGSFGRALFHHMNDNHLDFNLFPRPVFDSPIRYLSSRIYQDHDLWHVLLGYGVQVEDELAIQAFAVAQFRSPIAILLISGGLLHLLTREPRRAAVALANISRTFELGRRAPFLLTARLHELFPMPIEEVRRRTIAFKTEFSSLI